MKDEMKNYMSTEVDARGNRVPINIEKHINTVWPKFD